MALSIRDYTITKVFQDAHCKGIARYDTSRGIQCSYVSYLSKLDIV